MLDHNEYAQWVGRQREKYLVRIHARGGQEENLCNVMLVHTSLSAFDKSKIFVMLPGD